MDSTPTNPSRVLEPGSEARRGGHPCSKKPRVAIPPRSLFPVPTALRKGSSNDPFAHCRIGRLTGAHRCLPIPLQHCPFRTLRPLPSNETSTAPDPRCLCVVCSDRFLRRRKPRASQASRNTSNGDKPRSSDEAWRPRLTRQTGSPWQRGPSCFLKRVVRAWSCARGNHEVSPSLTPLGKVMAPRGHRVSHRHTR